MHPRIRVAASRRIHPQTLSVDQHFSTCYGYIVVIVSRAEGGLVGSPHHSFQGGRSGVFQQIAITNNYW